MLEMIDCYISWSQNGTVFISNEYSSYTSEETQLIGINNILNIIQDEDL